MTQPPFSIPVRVYYEDTDSGGVVYHANYLRFMERARTEWLRSLGFEQQRLLEDHVAFAVARVEVDYRGPARLDDLLTVTADLERTASRVSIQFVQRISKDDELLTRGFVKIVCIDTRSFRPTSIPQSLRDAFLNTRKLS